MTFEQLSIFVAVAEREHLTKAATAIGLTPSAVSSSIKSLESFYDVRLFERVGRRIELTQTGRAFLEEARATLARARAAERVLSELGGLSRGLLNIHASQTIASYWLPARLMRFHETYPQIEINLIVGNTQTVASAVCEGTAEIGFVEGGIAEPSLVTSTVGEDRLVVVVPTNHSLAGSTHVSLHQLHSQIGWIMREKGSGTRSEFEAALTKVGCDPSEMNIAMTLPSNESVLSAVCAGQCATAISSFAAAPYITSGALSLVDIELPPRAFFLLRHKERHLSAAARELVKICS